MINSDDIIELDRLKLSSSIRISNNEATSFDSVGTPDIKLFFEKQIGVIHIIDTNSNDVFLTGLPNMVYGRVKKNVAIPAATVRDSGKVEEAVGATKSSRSKVSKADKRNS